MVLDTYIIDQINRRREEERRHQEQPQIYVPETLPRREEQPHHDYDQPDRDIVQIPLENPSPNDTIQINFKRLR